MTAQCREWAHSGWRTVTELINTLGWRLFLSLIIFQHLIKGFVFGGGSGGLVGIPIEYLFQSYAAHGMPNLDAQSIQILRNVALTPWALKSLIGMVTDTLHLGGYNNDALIAGTQDTNGDRVINFQDDQSRWYLAELLAQAKQYAEAAEQYEEFAKRFPKDERAEDASSKGKAMRKKAKQP
jgi:hypothetical protein